MRHPRLQDCEDARKKNRVGPRKATHAMEAATHWTGDYCFGGSASRTTAPNSSLSTSTANFRTLSNSLVLSDE